MGYFLGHKMPYYNPFWEEPAYKDEPDWWKWYHLGHQDGYGEGSEYRVRLESLNQENEALRNLLDARARLDKQLPEEEQVFIKKSMSEYDTKDKTPDEQV